MQESREHETHSLSLSLSLTHTIISNKTSVKAYQFQRQGKPRCYLINPIATLVFPRFTGKVQITLKTHTILDSGVFYFLRTFIVIPVLF